MSGEGPARPLRVTKVIKPTLVVERGGGVPDGRREIWARHEEAPHFDVLLVTVHYNYGYHDNSSIDGVAQRIARAMWTGDENAVVEAA